MKTAGERKTKPLRHNAQQTEHMGGRLGQILLNYAAWNLRKNPATSEVFFLTSRRELADDEKWIRAA
jgi:hypothetical protein